MSPTPAISKRKRLRWTGIEISPHHSLKLPSSQHRQKSGKIVFKARIQPEPVLSVVDLKPFQRCERIVWLDESRSFAFHANSIPSNLAGSLALRQGLHHRGGHALLQLQQGSAHRLASSNMCSGEVATDDSRPSCLWRKRFAFRASRCTSSKEGILSSHSRRVAVGPQRSMARS